MARQPRIEYPGALYHVISRGIERRNLFRDDRDRERYLVLLERAVGRFGFSLYAYCLMNNHVHLAIEAGKVPLSRIMRSINTAYAGYFNVRHRRVGYLFQGRYKAFLVDSDSYLLALVRYIHENPVKAGIVTSVEVYVWSSHRSYLKDTPTWVACNDVLRRFGANQSRARKAFAEFLANSDGAPYEGADHHSQVVVGEKAFAESLLKEHPVPDLVLRRLTPAALTEWVAKKEKIDLVALRGEGRTGHLARARALCGSLAFSGGLSIASIAKYLNRTQSALWRQVQTFEQRAATDRAAAASLERYRRAVTALANNA